MKRSRKKSRSQKSVRYHRSLWVSFGVILLLLVSAIAILIYLEIHREQLSQLIRTGKWGEKEQITAADVSGFNKEFDRAVDVAFRQHGIAPGAVETRIESKKVGDIPFQYKSLTVKLPEEAVDPLKEELGGIVGAFHQGSLVTRREIRGEEERITLLLRMGNLVTRQVTLIPGKPILVEKKAPEPAKGLQLAIIVDDIGAALGPVRELLSLDIPLTFSILPGLENSKRAANLIAKEHREIMLHMPMEPINYPRNNPGKEALFVKMDHDEIRRRTVLFLNAVPERMGVNNHMGSRFTQDREGIALVLEEIKRRKLYFVDSVTSGKTVAYDEAVKRGVPAMRRDVFLDHVNEPQAVARQIDQLIRRVKKQGRALAICHPRENTIGELKKAVKRFRAEGIEVVPVSALMAKSS